jgi:hypothetical protein
MLNIDRARLSTPRNLPASLVNSYAKVNTNRHTRHQARERRRGGDWDDFLAIPLPLLWLDEVYAEVALFDAEEAIGPAPIIGLWP